MQFISTAEAAKRLGCPTKGRPKSKPEKPLRKSRKKSGKTPNAQLT
jgi:hypothetical protein